MRPEHSDQRGAQQRARRDHTAVTTHSDLTGRHDLDQRHRRRPEGEDDGGSSTPAESRPLTGRRVRLTAQSVPRRTRRAVEHGEPGQRREARRQLLGGGEAERDDRREWDDPGGVGPGDHLRQQPWRERLVARAPLVGDPEHHAGQGQPLRPRRAAEISGRGLADRGLGLGASRRPLDLRGCPRRSRRSPRANRCRHLSGCFRSDVGVLAVERASAPRSRSGSCRSV